MKTKEDLAREWSHPDKHDWHSCNGISLHPIREKAFLEGFNKAKELLLAAIKDSDTDAWDEDVIMGVGEQEVS